MNLKRQAFYLGNTCLALLDTVEVGFYGLSFFCPFGVVNCGEAVCLVFFPHSCGRAVFAPVASHSRTEREWGKIDGGASRMRFVFGKQICGKSAASTVASRHERRKTEAWRLGQDAETLFLNYGIKAYDNVQHASSFLCNFVIRL